MPDRVIQGKRKRRERIRKKRVIHYSERDDMTTILIVYHSQGGNNRKMAEAVADGVNSIESVRANFKEACEATLEDLLACDGIAIGSPEYFGYMSGAVKDFFDRTYESARGRVFRKPCVIFINAGNDGSGALRSIERICRGYQFKQVYEPIIAKGDITHEVLEVCREMGQTIAAGCEAGIY
ncbi:MAG: flavodoxin family protein [Desulfomonilia bacterium]